MAQLASQTGVSSPSRAAVLGLAAFALTGCAQFRDLRNRVVCVDAPAPPAYDLVQRVGTGFVLAYPDRTDPKSIDRVAYLLPDRDAVATMAPLGFGGALRVQARAHGPFAILAVDAPARPVEVTRDLPALVAKELGRRPSREALIGFSTGGTSALLAGEREPTRYAAVAVARPDFASDDAVATAARLSGPPVLIRIGESDSFVSGARTFAARCPTATLQVVRGCHDDGFWRASADALVGFAATGLFV